MTAATDKDVLARLERYCPPELVPIDWQKRITQDVADAAAEIRRLRADLDRRGKIILDLNTQMDKLEADLATARADAEQHGWLHDFPITAELSDWLRSRRARMK